MKRRAFIRLIGGLAVAWPLASYAQQPNPAQPKRVGILTAFECPEWWPAITPIRRRLAELRWIEGRNFVVDCVTTIGRLDQLPALAHELASRDPDVLISFPVPYIKALKQETTTIPIVMIGTPEPVRTGIITNLARPEGNVYRSNFCALQRYKTLQIDKLVTGEGRPLPPRLQHEIKREIERLELVQQQTTPSPRRQIARLGMVVTCAARVSLLRQTAPS